MGLDIGTRRIGVALSDETRTISSPLVVLDVSPGFDPVPCIVDLCREHQVSTVVVGLPLSLSGGSAGRSARLAESLGRRIEALAEIELVFVDERFSSAEANRLLVGAGQRRDQRRQTVDKVAAALILQVYLDGKTQEFQDD
jgi:putative Holliday junction resolvase